MTTDTKSEVMIVISDEDNLTVGVPKLVQDEKGNEYFLFDHRDSDVNDAGKPTKIALRIPSKDLDGIDAGKASIIALRLPKANEIPKDAEAEKRKLQEFRCEHCCQVFSTKSNLTRHEKKCTVKERENDPELLTVEDEGEKQDSAENSTPTPTCCPNCPAEFEYKYSLKRHLKNGCKPPGKGRKCHYPDCTAVFTHKSALTNHLRNAHDANIEPERELVFPSREAFLKWKDEEERRTGTCYTKHNGESNGLAYYHCQKDGGPKYKNRPESAVKKRSGNKKGRIKTGATCISMIKALTEKSGVTTVRYLSYHNHEINQPSDLEHQPLTKACSEFINQQLELGVSPEDILEALKSNNLDGDGENSRTQFVKLKTIKQRKRVLMERKIRTENPAITTYYEDGTEHQTDGANSVIIEVGSNEPHIIPDHTVYLEDIIVEPSFNEDDSVVYADDMMDEGNKTVMNDDDDMFYETIEDEEVVITSLLSELQEYMKNEKIRQVMFPQVVQSIAELVQECRNILEIEQEALQAPSEETESSQELPVHYIVEEEPETSQPASEEAEAVQNLTFILESKPETLSSASKEVEPVQITVTNKPDLRQYAAKRTRESSSNVPEAISIKKVKIGKDDIKENVQLKIVKIEASSVENEVTAKKSDYVERISSLIEGEPLDYEDILEIPNINLNSKVITTGLVPQMEKRAPHSILPISKIHLSKFTPNMVNLVTKAFNAPENEVLVEHSNISITGQDLRVLLNSEKLTNKIINFYLQLVAERGDGENFLKVYSFDTNSCNELLKSNFAFNENVDLLSYDFVLFPMNCLVKESWSLIAVDVKNRNLMHYDIFSEAPDTNCLKAVYRFLNAESLKRRQKRLDKSWKKVIAQNVSEQGNPLDSGVYVCAISEIACRRTPVCFTSKDIPRIRFQIAHEILTKKLL